MPTRRNKPDPGHQEAAFGPPLSHLATSKALVVPYPASRFEKIIYKAGFTDLVNGPVSRGKDTDG